MRNAVIGLIIGIVAGIVLGTTVIAPRLAQSVPNALDLSPSAEVTADPSPAATDAANASQGGDPAGSTTPAADASPADKAAPTPVTRLRMASAFAENLKVHGTAAKRLERTVWRISDGALDMRFFAPGALVLEKDALSAVMSGAIDAHFTSMETLAQREPALTLFAGPPFGSSVAAYLGWVSSKDGQRLLDEITGEMEIKTLVCGMVPHAGGGWFQKPLRTADELNGMRIRASGISAQLYRRLGVDVVEISFADTLLAMESGLLAGAQLSAPHVDFALGVAKAGQTYYVPGWTTPANVFTLVVSRKVWNELRPVQQTQLQTACSDNIRAALADSEAAQFNALKEITKAGVDVQPWPTEIRDAMRAAWAAEAKERQAGSQIFSRVLRSYRGFIKGQSIWEELTRP